VRASRGGRDLLGDPPSGVLPVPPPLRRAGFLGGNDSLAGCRRHGVPFAGADADDFVTFRFRPAGPLSSGNSGSTRCGYSASASTSPVSAESVQRRNGVIKALELGSETTVFDLKLFEYVREISHAEDSSLPLCQSANDTLPLALRRSRLGVLRDN
jgi:hypothetical protein